MPQTCPHCGTPLPDAANASCPECEEDLTEPLGAAKSRSSLNKAILLGNSIQLLFPSLLLLLMTGGIGYMFFGAVARRNMEGVVLGLVMLLGCAACWYVVGKLFLAALRD